MKVLMINGSPNKSGSTDRALREIRSELEKYGVEGEIYHIGKQAIPGCTACLHCRKSMECVFDDGVNEIAEKMGDYSGLIVGSPVYFAGPAGNLLSFMDRLFYAYPSLMQGMPAAAVSAYRRAGGTCTMDRLNKYFTIRSMPVVSTTYWNGLQSQMVEMAENDQEGLKHMRNLGKNMAWMVKLIKSGKEQGIEFPTQE